MLKILYKYYPLAYVILYRETTRKACGVGQWIRSRPKEKHDVSWSPCSFLCTAGVSAHAPGKEPGGPRKCYISVTSSSKRAQEKPVTSHLSHCNTTRLTKLGRQQYISLWGGVVSPLRWHQLSPSSSPPGHLYSTAMPSAFIFLFIYFFALRFYTYG